MGEREREAQKQIAAAAPPPPPPPPPMASTTASSGPDPPQQQAENSAWRWSPAVDAQLLKLAVDARFDFAVVAEKLCRAASDTFGAGSATVSSLQCRLRYAQVTDAKKGPAPAGSGDGSSDHAPDGRGR